MNRRRASSVIAAAVATALVRGRSLLRPSDARAASRHGTVAAYYKTLRARESTPVATEAVRAGISSGLGYVKNHTLPSGQFVYAVNLNPAVVVEPGYNMLRHAGAIYAIRLASAVVPDPAAVGGDAAIDSFHAELLLCEGRRAGDRSVGATGTDASGSSTIIQARWGRARDRRAGEHRELEARNHDAGRDAGLCEVRPRVHALERRIRASLHPEQGRTADVGRRAVLPRRNGAGLDGVVRETSGATVDGLVRKSAGSTGPRSGSRRRSSRRSLVLACHG